MTTEELKKELEELGLSLCNHGFDAPYYTVEDKNGFIFAQVDYKYEYIVEVCRKNLGDQEKQRKLFNAVTEYAATPIEERENKKRYKYRLKRFVSESVISCMADTFLNYKGFGQIFYLDNDKEIGDAKTIFREGDPELELVNLDMFEAIEVDAEGNELHD